MWFWRIFIQFPLHTSKQNMPLSICFDLYANNVQLLNRGDLIQNISIPIDNNLRHISNGLKNSRFIFTFHSDAIFCISFKHNFHIQLFSWIDMSKFNFVIKPSFSLKIFSLNLRFDYSHFIYYCSILPIVHCRWFFIICLFGFRMTSVFAKHFAINAYHWTLLYVCVCVYKFKWLKIICISIVGEYDLLDRQIND